MTSISPISIGKPQLVGHDLDRDLAQADLAGERMVAAIAALGRIAERQQEAFVAARQGLQPRIALGRERQRLARQVGDRRGLVAGQLRLQQAFRAEDPCDRRHRLHRLRLDLAGIAAIGRRLRHVGQRRNRAGGGCSRRSGPAPGRRACP